MIRVIDSVNVEFPYVHLLDALGGIKDVLNQRQIDEVVNLALTARMKTIVTSEVAAKVFENLNKTY